MSHLTNYKAYSML